MTIRRMHIACWIPKATNAHSEYVICFSIATMVALMRLSVTLYARCLFYLIISMPLTLMEKCSEHEMCTAFFRATHVTNVYVSDTYSASCCRDAPRFVSMYSCKVFFVCPDVTKIGIFQ